MKYPTKYRFLIWDEKGRAVSISTPEVHPYFESSIGGLWQWKSLNMMGSASLMQKEFNGMCPGKWDEVMLDMEIEEDRLYVEALMEL